VGAVTPSPTRSKGGGQLFDRPRAIVVASATRRRDGNTNRRYEVRGYRGRARSI
jgi:hypothetical protein